jgi:hypothetical protein
MIYITKNSTNEFALTLTESTTISNPYFLFKFVWEYDENLPSAYWVGTDYSLYPERYNLFYLSEPTEVDFKQGQYRYEVYESPIDIIVDENTDETGLNKIEEGRMVVEGDGNTIYD